VVRENTEAHTEAPRGSGSLKLIDGLLALKKKITSYFENNYT
jgi:hypothetical protein